MLKDIELWNCSFNPYHTFFHRTDCLAYLCLEISVVRIPVTASDVKIKIIFISLSLAVLIPSFIFLLQNQVFGDPGLRESGDCRDLSLSVFWVSYLTTLSRLYRTGDRLRRWVWNMAGTLLTGEKYANRIRLSVTFIHHVSLVEWLGIESGRLSAWVMHSPLSLRNN